MAYATAKDAPPESARRFSPNTLAKPQVFAGLVFDEFLKTEYRDMVSFLGDGGNWCAATEPGPAARRAVMLEATIPMSDKPRG